MTKYRGGVIGLGWMGMLYDLAARIDDYFDIDDVDRPTPELNIHRKFHYHEHPGNEGTPSTYAEALWDRPEVDLVAGADRDQKRLKSFKERYGAEALYTDAEEMLKKENLDILAICTNTKGRADLTCLAVECGVKGIMTEKPMAHTLEEADRMVKACADAGVPLCCGAITTTHPSFGRAKELVTSGAIGEVVSIETSGPTSQHQNWSYFVESAPTWVIGVGDPVRRGPRIDEFGIEAGVPGGPENSNEFGGEGMMVTVDGLVVHFRKGAFPVRVHGTAGEIVHCQYPTGWRLWKDVETPGGGRRVEMPWPEPQMVGPYGAVYGFADIFDCLKGKLDEPKNSGRRVAVALEVEIALKQSSAQGSVRVDLPLEDRSPGLNYEWFR